MKLYKVYELENDENNKLIIISCHYFCSEWCQDKFLAPCELLWSQIEPFPDEEKNVVCSCCGTDFILFKD